SAGTFLQRLRRLSYPWAASVVLQSQDSLAAFQQMVPRVKNLDVVPNPLPPDLRDIELGQAPAVPTSNRRLLMGMGRLVPFKRFDALIQAFAALASDYPDWDLAIWGEGPQRDELIQQIQETGLANRISLPGRTEQPWQEMVKADIFVLTSQVEGFPNVLLEAMALGRACVTVDCPSGPRELSQDGKYALLTPLGDQPALCRAIAQLMDDSTLREVMGRHAAASVEERYGLSEILLRWDAVIAKVQPPVPEEQAVV
ncbi:MAG TPA: glycosyltransferase, partial [Pusillimonas sp.]